MRHDPDFDTQGISYYCINDKDKVETRFISFEGLQASDINEVHGRRVILSQPKFNPIASETNVKPEDFADYRIAEIIKYNVKSKLNSFFIAICNKEEEKRILKHIEEKFKKWRN